jgi:hypothetical protein
MMEIAAIEGYFPFKLGKLGWFNCDIYWDESNPKTTLHVTLTGNPGSLASYQGGTGHTCVFFHDYGDLVLRSYILRMALTELKVMMIQCL